MAMNKWLPQDENVHSHASSWGLQTRYAYSIPLQSSYREHLLTEENERKAIYLFIGACLLNDNVAINETLAVLVIRKQHWCSKMVACIVDNYKGVPIIHSLSLSMLHHPNALAQKKIIPSNIQHRTQTSLREKGK